MEPAIAAVGQLPATGTAIHNSLGLPFPARWETARVIWWAASGPDGKPGRAYGQGAGGARAGSGCAGLTGTARGA
jgi:hypothetical protein